MNTEPTVPLDPRVTEQPPAFEPPVFDRPADAAPTPPPAPRIRWAGIVWGLVFAAIAVVSLWVLAAASRREAIAAWAKALSPESVSPGVLLGVLVLGLGALLIVVGGIALLRRLSTARRA